MTCETLVDICVLVDSSESIRRANPSDGSHDNWELVLSFVNSIIGEFPVGEHGARIGVVSFSNSARLEFPLNRYDTKQQLQDAVSRVPYMAQWTNTAAALTVARTECFRPHAGDRPQAKNIAIVITDGIPTLNAHLVAFEAEALRASGVTMLAVGITDEVNAATLRTLASPPQVEGVNFFTSPDFRSLDSVLQDLVPQTCVTQPPPGRDSVRAVTRGALCCRCLALPPPLPLHASSMSLSVMEPQMASRGRGTMCARFSGLHVSGSRRNWDVGRDFRFKAKIRLRSGSAVAR